MRIYIIEEKVPKTAKSLRILAFSAKVLPIVLANEIDFG